MRSTQETWGSKAVLLWEAPRFVVVWGQLKLTFVFVEVGGVLRMDSCDHRLARTRLLTLLAFEFYDWVTHQLLFEALQKTLQLQEAVPLQVMTILVIHVSTTLAILNGHQHRPKNRSET